MRYYSLWALPGFILSFPSSPAPILIDLSGPPRPPLISHHISRAECGFSSQKDECGSASGLDSEVERRSPDMVLHDLANQLYIDSKGKGGRRVSSGKPPLPNSCLRIFPPADALATGCTHWGGQKCLSWIWVSLTLLILIHRVNVPNYLRFVFLSAQLWIQYLCPVCI